MMQHIGLGGFIISLVYSVISGDLFGFLEFVAQYPLIIQPIMIVSILGVLG
jgi:hypothetical protein